MIIFYSRYKDSKEKLGSVNLSFNLQNYIEK